MTGTVTTRHEVLRVDDLRVSFPTDEGLVEAVRGTSFSLVAGRVLGIVGESGCGKSVMSRAIMRLLPPQARVSGRIVLTRGSEKIDVGSLDPDGEEIRAIRGASISMIFQEPMKSLSPFYTIGNQILEAIYLHRTSDPEEATSIAVAMLERLGISNAAERMTHYPHEFSGGMRQRVMIAMALSCRPAVLIADEPTTALDVTIQAQVLDLVSELQREMGTAVIFVTHDLGVVAEICDDVGVMYLGRLVELGSVEQVLVSPTHPYTKALLRSTPRLGMPRGTRLPSIPGVVPVPIGLPRRCSFWERCDERVPGRCDTGEISVAKLSDGRSVRCVHAGSNVEVAVDE